MRIVIKPLGVVALAGVLVTLVVLIMFGGKQNSPELGAVPNLLEVADWKLVSTNMSDAGMDRSPGPASLAGNEKAFRIQIRRKPPQEENIRFYQKIGEATETGETVTLRFWTRSGGGTPFRACLEQELKKGTEAPPSLPLDKTITPTEQWKEYTFPVPVSSAAAGQTSVRFYLGVRSGEIELADIRLTSP